MKLNASQLESHLQGGLAPLYFLSGDEILLVQEAADTIRAAARAQGYSEREVMHVDRSFDWAALNDASDTLSLFAERRIVELRMPTGKPGDAGRKALLHWVERPPEDTLLLIITGKLEASVPKTKWFKTLEAAGASLTIWPLEPARLPGWVGARMRERGLQPDVAAVELLSQRVEGNLLAAAQEIDKLQLLHGSGQITVEDIDEAVVDNARFDIYRLVDTALDGDAAQTQRMFNRLQDEGIEPVLLLWVLGRELRSLASMAAECAGSGGPPGDAAVEQVMTRYRVWQKRKPLIKKALQRSGPRRWQGLVLVAARIDRVIKGQLAGNVRDELLQLCLALAGMAVATGLQRRVAQARG
ncbi:DNA polymerase III subunit delta [Sulfuriflexus mobilis]|uniref:DNA polymerase III subunit delta n=1 Tax=Sulfuriflexus mobilis TaxID=1811807 RepID=UPI000F824905|nr:DNA polymerase III subunit delta [Sulfuriflexus mobilis]